MATWCPGEKELVNNSNGDNFIPIVKNEGSEHDEKYRSKWIGSFSSTKTLLKNLFENHGNNIWLAEMGGALYLWIGWVFPLLDLDDKCTWWTEMTNGCRIFLFMGKVCPPQHRHNDF